MTVDLSVTTLYVAVLVVVAYILFGRRLPGPPLPGPKGYPLIGTILPRESPWVKMTEYSKQCGAYCTLVVHSCLIMCGYIYRGCVRYLDPIHTYRHHQLCPGCARVS